MATKKQGDAPEVTVYEKGGVVRVAETAQERVAFEFDGFRRVEAEAPKKEEPKPAPPKSDAK